MKNMRFVLFCILFRVCFMINKCTSAADVQFIRQRKTWFGAQQMCELKGGRLATDKDNTLTCDKLKGALDSDKGSTFWSGRYTTMTDWISREGCYDISNITEMSHSVSLSECFEVCRHQHTILHRFAYRSRDQKCVCSHSNAFMKKHEGYNCSDFLKSNRTYFVYRVIQMDAFRSTGNCAFVDCSNNHSIEASSCNDRRTPFCGSVSHDYNWEMSQEKCKDTIPKKITNICTNINHDDHGGIWLPIKKEALSIAISDDGIYHEQSVTQCTSYLCNTEKEDNRTIANTACRNKTDGFFCFFPIKSITTTHVTTEQQTVNILIEHIGTKDATKYSKQTATSYTGLIVGGVVGAVLLTVVIVLVIVLKIRYKNATTKKENDNFFALSNGKSHIYEHQHRKTCSSNDKIFNNKLYDEQRLPYCNDEQRLPSCKMVPDKNIRIKKDREDYNRQNYVFAVPIGIQGTPSTQKPEDCKDGIDVESEYDMLNKIPRSLNSSLEHNIYDSTIASRCESDPTYNTATNNLSNRKDIDGVYDIL